MTSQKNCDVTDVHYDAKKPSASENLSYSNRVLARSSVTRLRGKRGKLNYNRFFPEPTHNFLDHPSNQEVGPRGQTVPHNISNVRSTTRNCKISYSAPRSQWARINEDSSHTVHLATHCGWWHHERNAHRCYVTKMAESHYFHAKVLPCLPGRFIF